MSLGVKHERGNLPKSVQIWTSTEYLGFMSALVRELENSGISVKQCFLVTHQEYRRARSGLERFCLRFKMYVTYPLMLISRCICADRSTIMIVTTNTFYAPALASLVRRIKGAPVVHLVYDLYPEVLESSGLISSSSILCRVLEVLTKYTCTRCEMNVFLGARLLAYAEETYGPISGPRVIPVGADGSPFNRLPPTPREASDPVTILYCGNMGRLHDVTTLLDTVFDPSLRPSRSIMLRINANGVGLRALRQRLERQESICSVKFTFGGELKDSEWTAAMLEADIALVTMVQGAENVLMPSKTYSALVAGQAILAICPETSDLATLVRSHDCGWVIPVGDTASLKDAFIEISLRPDLVLEKRRRAFAAGHTHFDSKAVCKQWMDLLSSV